PTPRSSASRCCGTRWTTWSPRGGRSGPNWTWSRCRCSAGSPGWPGTWTSRGAGRSPSTSSSRGRSTCSRRCAGRARRSSSRRGRCSGPRWSPPAPLPPGALLRATLDPSGTMTNRIDRLAAEGLVRREPDPRDKRGVLVTLTEQGQERVDAALAGLLRRERALLADLDDAERRNLADLMRILLAPFDAAEEGCRVELGAAGG